MRHRVAGRTFGRRPEQRQALMRGLANSLLDHGRITTTVAKAKELRKYVEPLVTLAKRGDLHARRQVAAFLYRRETVSKLFGEVAERFKGRPGGYTRIYRLGRRIGDGAEQAMIELIPAENAKARTSDRTSEKKSASEEKKPAAPKKKAKPAAEKATKKKPKAPAKA